jgi:hypothetical protein
VPAGAPAAPRSAGGSTGLPSKIGDDHRSSCAAPARLVDRRCASRSAHRPDRLSPARSRRSARRARPGVPRCRTGQGAGLRQGGQRFSCQRRASVGVDRVTVHAMRCAGRRPAVQCGAGVLTALSSHPVARGDEELLGPGQPSDGDGLIAGHRGDQGFGAVAWGSVTNPHGVGLAVKPGRGQRPTAAGPGAGRVQGGRPFHILASTTITIRSSGPRDGRSRRRCNRVQERR